MNKTVITILRKILFALISIFIIFTITFFLLEIIPGEVYDIDNIKNEIVADNIRSKYQLDASVWERYLSSLRNLLQLDFGNSFLNEGRSVNDIIIEHFPISALYGGMALVSSFFTAMIFGVLLSKTAVLKNIMSYIVITIISIPSFVLASLLQYWFCVKLRLFPVFATTNILGSIIPLITIGLPLLMTFTRLFMDSMLEVRDKDYYIQAKSLGISKLTIMSKYLVKNSLTSVLTYIGVVLADLLVGSFIVETTFNIPGLGRYFINSITNRDYPVIMGLTIFYSILIISFNSITDIIVHLFNYGGERAEVYEK